MKNDYIEAIYKKLYFVIDFFNKMTNTFLIILFLFYLIVKKIIKKVHKVLNVMYVVYLVILNKLIFYYDYVIGNAPLNPLLISKWNRMSDH